MFVVSDPLTVGNTVAKCFRAQTPSSPPAQLNLLNFCRFVSFASFFFLYTFLNINGTKIKWCGSCYFLGDVQKFSRFYSMLFLSRNTSVVSHRRSRFLIFEAAVGPWKQFYDVFWELCEAREINHIGVFCFDMSFYFCLIFKSFTLFHPSALLPAWKYPSIFLTHIKLTVMHVIITYISLARNEKHLLIMKQNAKQQAAILRKASEDRWQLRASQILLITLREADNQKWNQMGVWRKQAFTDVCQREEVFQEWPSSWSNRLYFQTVW